MRKKKILGIMLCMTLGLMAGCTAQQDNKSESNDIVGEQKDSQSTQPVDINWKAEIGGEFDTFNPIQTVTQAGRSIAANCFEGLMKIGEDGKLVAGQAESYKISDDGLTYTFTLREDAAWSDGKDVTAEQFVRAWEQLIQSEQASKLSMVENANKIIQGEQQADTLGVEAKDEKTLVVNLSYADPFFLQVCADPATAPMREDVELGETWSKGSYVCNGAYRVTKAADTQVVLEKNESYYDRDGVSGEKMTLLWNDADSAAELEAGDLFFAESVEEAVGDENATWDEYASVTQQMVGIFVDDMSQKGESDASNAIRSAMGLAVDREYLHEKQGEGWDISHSFLPKEITGTAQDKETFDSDDYESDVSKGVEMLTDAKVDVSEVQIKVYEDVVQSELTELLSDMWGDELGFEMLTADKKFSKDAAFQGTAFLTQRTVDGATLEEAVPVCELQMAFYVPDVDVSDVLNVNRTMHESAVLVPIFQTVNWYGVSSQVQGVYTLNGCHYFTYVCAK